MSRNAALVTILLVLNSVGAAAPSKLSLDWMVGHWCATTGESAVEELWLPAHGGVMVGLGRTTKGSRTIGFEYLRIVIRDSEVTYLAQPGGNTPTEFQMTSVGDSAIEFQNKQHDFPQRIVYRREGDNLLAMIAGPGDVGAEIVIEFDYKPCDQ